MTFPKLAVLCALSPWTLLGAAVETGLPDSTSPSIVHHSNVQAFRTPFFFERNKGQYAPEVKFYHRSRDYSFFLTATEMVTVFRRDKRQTGPSDSLKIKFLGTQSWARAVGEDPLESRSHYFLGDRPDRWVTGVEHFQRVRIANLYPGIDAVFYGRRGEIEYDLEVRPGADPHLIRLQVESSEGIHLDERGRLLARLREGQVVQEAPFIYQGTRTRPQPVGGSYRLLDSRVFGFEVAQYDPSLILVIDPLVLVYSTYLGGTERDDGHAITVDDDGNAYTTGETASDDFPREGSPNDPVSGTFDVFVSKFSSDGGSLIFSTILGGTGADVGVDIALGPDGSVFVAGSASANFPTTPGAFDTERSGASDGFVVRLSPDGSQLLYSTYLGGARNENTWGLAVDAGGSAYVVGDTTSDDFPTASFQETFAGNVDGFLTKLTPDGTGIVYSTYIGGSAGGAVGRDKATDVAVDDQNCAYVVGVTGSDDFPLTAGAFQTQLDVADGFVAKFATDGQSQIYSTLVGGNNIDSANGIAIDQQGNAYLTGALSSGAIVTFPTRNPIQDAPAGLTDSFVAKLNRDGSDLVYSTYLGGSAVDRATSIAVDGEGNAIVSGYTTSRNFPIVDPLPGVVADGSPMFFITKFNAAGSAHVYSTLLGGSEDDRSGAIPGGNSVAADRYGSAYVIGTTSSTDFPIASFQEEYGGGSFDVAVAKISERFEAFFAQVGNGGGLVSEPVISNSSTGNWMSGSMQFTDDNADPLEFNLTVSGGEDVLIDGNMIHYDLPPLGSITMTSDGQGPVIPGAAKAEGNGKFGAVVRFTLPGIGTTGVAASQPLAGFISPVRRNAEGINTGIGIVSLADGLVDLELELRDQQGGILAMETIEDFGPCEHLSQFIDQLFATVDTSDFQGSIVVRAIGGQIAATAIELGDDPGEFTTLPVTELN